MRATAAALFLLFASTADAGQPSKPKPCTQISSAVLQLDPKYAAGIGQWVAPDDLVIVVPYGTSGKVKVMLGADEPVTVKAGSGPAALLAKSAGKVFIETDGKVASALVLVIPVAAIPPPDAG